MLPETDRVSQWDQLQEPMCHTNHPTGYMRLLAALDSGWIVNCVRYQPAQAPNMPGKYDFNLVHAGGNFELRTLQLPQCYELTQFICDENLLPCCGSQPCFM